MLRKSLVLGLMAFFLGSCATGTVQTTPEVLKTSGDGRFVAYNNGTVRDVSTGLIWAAKDSGGPISWEEAREYCRNYRAGGFSDWRMPSQEELAALYNPQITSRRTAGENCKGGYHVTELIHLTCCCIWYWNGIDEVGGFFHFDTGPEGWRDQALSNHPRALPVRDPR